MNAPQPQLDKPGAGLPLLESLLVRWWVGPFVSRRNDRDANLRFFRLLGSRILKEANAVPDGRRDERVLIPRMKGIEDSSRFWSANEALEHLMITGAGMRGLIVELANGRTSGYVVRIEDFKPTGKYTGGDARADFKAFTQETADLLAPLPIADSGPTHLHPWMGQFNALQWTWLLAGHSGIHLAQLSAIKQNFLS